MQSINSDILQQMAQFAKLIEGTPHPSLADSGIKIVILQRGFVFVGRLSRDGAYCHLDSAFNLRRWGTTQGLGEIAFKGPTPKTLMDACPRVTFHELTVVAMLDCEVDTWMKYCK